MEDDPIEEDTEVDRMISECNAALSRIQSQIVCLTAHLRHLHRVRDDHLNHLHNLRELAYSVARLEASSSDGDEATQVAW
jgi:hypothetical protein